MPAAHVMDWVPLSEREPAAIGDLVSADAGGLPIYRVMALEEGRAWVATRAGAPARAMPLAGFRWKGVGG
jgi:hypothetical protein